MDKKKNAQDTQPQQGHHEHPLRQEISKEDRKRAEAAHDAAEQDIQDDAELTASSPNDDLDEGETARLGEDTILI